MGPSFYQSCNAFSTLIISKTIIIFNIKSLSTNSVYPQYWIYFSMLNSNLKNILEYEHRLELWV